MTKRILVDARPLQIEAYATRGIGAHLRGWLREAPALQARFGVEIILLIDSDLPLPPLPPFSRHALRMSQPGRSWFDPDLMLRGEAVLFEAARAARADLVHITYPLAEEFCPPGRLPCLSVVSLYDTILFDRAEAYFQLHSRRERAGFLRRVEGIGRATRIQTLSRASAEDIARWLSPSPPIDVVSCSVGANIHPLPDRGATRVRQLGLPSTFVLTVTAAHPSKNLAGLLEAFAQLDPALREAFPLVIVMRETPEQAERHRALIASLGIQSQVFRLQQVSDQDLVALYNKATLFVCASLQEGFGMPVLEAMRCGTPVACSNTSSLPEVGGGAVAYFDPRSPAHMAGVIAGLLQNAEQRAALGEAGLVRSQQFSWAVVAEAVLASYQQALKESPTLDDYGASRTKKKPLRIAFWSPLPPVPSGISDYSESLLGAMSQHPVEIEVFTDGYQPNAAMRSPTRQALFSRFPVWDWRAFFPRHAEQPFDACLFHFGNSPHHAYLLRALARLGRLSLPYPIEERQAAHECAVVGVFHDGSLYHLFAEGMSARFAHAVMQQERKKGLSHELTESLLGPVVRACDGVITHSRFVLERCQGAHGAAFTRQIPFGIELFLPTNAEAQKYLRRLLGLPEEGVIFGVFGHVHPAKRFDPLIEAWENDPPADAWLYILGTVHEPAPVAVRALLADPRRAEASRIILRDSYLPYETLLLAMHAVDVGVNLRYPTHGETSAALCSLLGMGKPVIASDVGAFREFPDTCVLKVPVGEGEQQRLRSLFHTLSDDAHLRCQLAESAHRFAAAQTWSHAADKCVAFIQEVCARGAAQICSLESRA